MFRTIIPELRQVEQRNTGSAVEKNVGKIKTRNLKEGRVLSALAVSDGCKLSTRPHS